ncbi:MAG: hypothetical protein M1814_000740 [Vezdaea aestivalis]|nr:MAG: hypothetical protein M1814_000740 [Vezdaea aestivalis]
MAGPSVLISSAGEAVARVAYLCSDTIISVKSDPTEPDQFSSTFQSLAEDRVPSLTGSRIASIPEILQVRSNNDPLLSTFSPIHSGHSVSVTAPSSILLSSVPHLYKLAQLPIVIHISLQPSQNPDVSAITAIRQSGFTFLQSETLQEAHDIALSAHALAIQSGKGVIHFFHSELLAHDRPIEPNSVELLQAALRINFGTRFPDPDQDEEPLHADSGLVAVVTEPRDVGHETTSSGHKLFETSSTPRTLQSSINGSSLGSSRRESSVESGPSVSSVTSVESLVTRSVTSADVLRCLDSIWALIKSRTGRGYHAFEYSGPKSAKVALFIFGGDAGLFGDAIDNASSNEVYAKVGIITARLYRPWLVSELTKAIPSSVRKIGILEQVSKRTTKWGPVFLDLLASFSSSAINGPTPIGFKLGLVTHSTIAQALRGVCQNLLSQNPIQNLDVGAFQKESTASDFLVPKQPKVELAYMKILDQLFDGRLKVANNFSSQHAGLSLGIASTPEFGFGSLLARIERRQDFLLEVKEAANNGSFTTNVPKTWLSKWLLHHEKSDANTVAEDAIARLSVDGSPLAAKFLASRPLFFKESQWLIGSDSWAYDLSNSGVHHVIASGKNINMLIIDSEPYSERSAAESSRRKKDIGLYAMNFGNAYVGSVAVYSSYTQVLQTLIEADQFDGPSVVLAYLPQTKADESPLTVLQETKKAVDLGYWPLYRWNPNNEGSEASPRFSLDSERIKADLHEFLRRDNHLTQLSKRSPQFSANLAGSVGSEVRKLQRRKAKDAYSKLLEGLYGASLTILFASDNGNSESLAKRLANRGKARGLKTMVFAMDDYPIEDLAAEENIVMLTSTAGQGEFPQNGRSFWDAVKDTTDLDLSQISFSVFALGDSHYWPRKEDKIYYNKPGKDLDTRISFLGGKRLAEVGLGDDQDPDTYHTGYAEWEPKLWRALGVDNVEGLPDEPPPITNEDIKIESNYLRGTIAEGLADKSTGAISAADQQLTKFHGTYMQDDRDLRDERKAQGLEPAYSFMIRCRLPGGVATPQQWIQMDDVCNSFGNETMKLTTRQTFQFHGVVKGKLRAAMQGINQSLMTTIAACGDVNRNVMCSSLPERSQYHREVYAISQNVSDHLLPSTTAYHEIWLQEENDKKTQIAGNAVADHEPLYGPTYLPRKFKITIAIPPHNDTDVYAHDVGLIAIQGADGHLEGFNVLAGGGMGVTHNNKKTYPRTGSMFGFVPANKVHFACEKIMLVQRDYGDRKNRKHARLKYTIDDMGVDVFKGKVEDLLGHKFEAPRPFHFDSNIDTFGWQRDETGNNHFTFFIENGRIEDTAAFPMKTGLREIAKANKGEFRLTGNQHLILSNVADEDLPKIKDLMAKHKLNNVQFSALRLSSSACVAFPTCGLAMAESERYLPELITKLEGALEENGLRQESIVMRMTGCPNGCARPWLAEVGFVGKAFGAYNMYLGGGYHGQRLSKLYRSSIKEEEILEIMKPLLKRYALERYEGERFGDFVIRIGLIKETKEGKFFHDDTAEAESEEE